MNENKAYYLISEHLSPELKRVLLKVPEKNREALTEIRIRCRRPISFVYPGKTLFMTKNAELTNDPYNKDCFQVQIDEIHNIVDKLCHYSVHSSIHELQEGFFSIGEGVRVGVSGKMTSTERSILTDINGLNFRIAREVKGSALELFERINKGKSSVLICGGVNSGKTTILRDLCRMCGNSFKTVLIDERNEIAAVNSGISSNDVGIQTDILTFTGRAAGINMAIRTLSPEMIFCDEISTFEDVDAILNGHGSGVRFAATIHSESFEELKKRNISVPLLQSGVFEYAAFLKNGLHPAEIKELRRL